MTGALGLHGTYATLWLVNSAVYPWKNHHDQRAQHLAYERHPARQKAAVDFVINGLEKGSLKPIMGRVFAFGEIVDAHRCNFSQTR